MPGTLKEIGASAALPRTRQQPAGASAANAWRMLVAASFLHLLPRALCLRQNNPPRDKCLQSTGRTIIPRPLTKRRAKSLTLCALKSFVLLGDATVFMDIFDEVDMESSRTDDQLGERIPPSRIQDSSTGLRYPKVIRTHEDEVPHGADCGESRSCLEPRPTFYNNSYVLN